MTEKSSTSGLTFEEVSESVTGFDEIAVTKHLDMDLYADAERKPVLMMRALVFVHKRHQGVPDLNAREQALAMPLREVNAYFEASDDLDPDGDPDSDSGKGDSAPVTPPTNSPPSAS